MKNTRHPMIAAVLLLEKKVDIKIAQEVAAMKKTRKQRKMYAGEENSNNLVPTATKKMNIVERVFWK